MCLTSAAECTQDVCYALEQLRCQPQPTSPLTHCVERLIFNALAPSGALQAGLAVGCVRDRLCQAWGSFRLVLQVMDSSNA